MSQYVESHFNLCFRVWNVEISVLFVAVWNLTYIKVHARFLTCIPPRVLILVRRLISADGTQSVCSNKISILPLVGTIFEKG
jgi:hypothetical protein